MKELFSEKGKRMTLWQTVRYLLKKRRERKMLCKVCYGKGYFTFYGSSDKPCPRCKNL